MNHVFGFWKKACVAACLIASTGGIAVGQVSIEDLEDRSSKIYRMKLTPTAAPVPIFKYRFSFLPHETVAGNAATHYLRSLGEKSLSAPMDAAYEAHGDEFYDWQSSSDVAIEDLLKTKAKEVAANFDSYIDNYIARATRCRNCEWGYGTEDMRGPDVLGFLLPSVQDTRNISRVLALQTRVAIAEKRFDDAVRLMRMNYQLAGNVNKMNFLVSSLVAIGEVGITNDTMIDLIATPGSPNMYWALTELPRPIVDLRDSFRMDVTMFNRIFPELFEAAGTDRSVEHWKGLMEELADSIAATAASTGQARTSRLLEDQSPPTPEQLAFKLGPTVVGILGYKNAKQQLIDNGEDAKDVEAMPVGQVLTTSMVTGLNKFSNGVERLIYIPFAQAKDGWDQEEEKLEKAQSLVQPDGLIASLLLPAGRQISGAQARVQRDIDAMRVIEAIRMHAAETGQLPETLDDISVVPIPLNPATNKPFDYQLNDGTATLKLPRSDGIYYSRRFELRL